MSENRIKVLWNDSISGAVIMPLFPEGGKKANYKSQLGVTVLHLVLMMNYVTEESRKENTSQRNSSTQKFNSHSTWKETLHEIYSLNWPSSTCNLWYKKELPQKRKEVICLALILFPSLSFPSSFFFSLSFSCLLKTAFPRNGLDKSTVNYNITNDRNSCFQLGKNKIRVRRKCKKDR